MEGFHKTRYREPKSPELLEVRRKEPPEKETLFGVDTDWEWIRCNARWSVALLTYWGRGQVLIIT
ncbi:hypothetical protein ColTof4_03252 [Colletotrichum tofieldiae]|nr:hypothetical protein ColTof3_13333 [Colletotrichum tofieldiae]GKT70829.1 hypothetical protein ColTof4_03252 [Colletotrichum tofieldiae]